MGKTERFFYKKKSGLKQAISVVTITAFLWMQLGMGAISANPTYGSGNRGVTFYQYSPYGFSIGGVDLKTGYKTNYVAGKVDYTYYIGSDGKEIKITNYEYTEEGQINRIIDCTTGKYIQYGEIKNSQGDVSGWGALNEYDAADNVIGRYNYNDEGVLVSKDLFSLADSKKVQEQLQVYKNDNYLNKANSLENKAKIIEAEALMQEAEALRQEAQALRQEAEELKPLEQIGKTTLVGRIYYTGGQSKERPVKEVVFLEQYQDNNGNKQYQYWGFEGRTVKEWEYDTENKLTKAHEYKIDWEGYLKAKEQYNSYEESYNSYKSKANRVWLSKSYYKRLEGEFLSRMKSIKTDAASYGYKETTIYNDKEKPVEITRNGQVVGTFTYQNNFLTQSTYTDVKGLVTTTQFDKLERAVYAVTEGYIIQEIDFGSDIGKRNIRFHINTERKWFYNDTSETVTNADGRTVRAGGLDRVESVTHSVSDYFSFSVNKKSGKGWKKVKYTLTISGVIDTTTKSTEFYSDGDLKRTTSETKNDNNIKTDVKIKRKGWITFFVALITLAVAVFMPTALNALGTMFGGTSTLIGKAFILLGEAATAASKGWTLSLNVASTGLNTATALKEAENMGNQQIYDTSVTKTDETVVDDGTVTEIKDEQENVETITADSGDIGYTGLAISAVLALTGSAIGETMLPMLFLMVSVPLANSRGKDIAPKNVTTTSNQSNAANPMYNSISIRPPVEPPTENSKPYLNYTPLATNPALPW